MARPPLLSVPFAVEGKRVADRGEFSRELRSATVAALQSSSSVSELLVLHERGAVTALEIEEALWAHCHDKPVLALEITKALQQHPSEVAHSIGHGLERSLRRRQEQLKDVDLIRGTSPLQPGARLILSGGYTAAFSQPWWLNGGESYKATFVGFAERGYDKMPAAMVKLDCEIDMTEESGLRHRGQNALLSLLHVANWVRTEIVTVHVVESLPEDVEAFYSTHPFGTEIETHARYAIAQDDRVATTAPSGNTEPGATAAGRS
jgi:hypothetical protein